MQCTADCVPCYSQCRDLPRPNCRCKYSSGTSPSIFYAQFVFWKCLEQTVVFFATTFQQVKRETHSHCRSLDNPMNEELFSTFGKEHIFVDRTEELFTSSGSICRHVEHKLSWRPQDPKCTVYATRVSNRHIPCPLVQRSYEAEHNNSKSDTPKMARRTKIIIKKNDFFFFCNG